MLAIFNTYVFIKLFTKQLDQSKTFETDRSHRKMCESLFLQTLLSASIFKNKSF